MSRYPGNNSTAARKSEGRPLLTGILIGLIGGVALSAGVAWFAVKSNQFPHSEPGLAVKHPQLAAPETVITQSAPVAASGVAEDKPRFEFYKVLTDKEEATVASQEQSGSKTAQKPAAKETYYLQVGSFSDADEAEQLKAKLTMLDMDVSVQTVNLPDKGVWHRVRVGPFRSADEMNKARGTLKQNGVNTTPIHEQ